MVIEGKVAEILDKYTLAANIGEEDGVEEGMTFEVYEEGPMITDPDTGEELGKPETVKIQLKVKKVREKMSIMETKKTTVRRNTLSGSLLNVGASVETKQEKMKTDAYDSVKEDRKTVKRGDGVRQVVENSNSE